METYLREGSLLRLSFQRDEGECIARAIKYGMASGVSVETA
jgi:hypothetical protein